MRYVLQRLASGVVEWFASGSSALAIILLVEIAPETAHAATATASSGGPALSEVKGKNKFTFTNPVADDRDVTIVFTSGVNHTDGKAWPQVSSDPQSKFDNIGAEPKGRTFTPFPHTDGPGPLESFAITNGKGGSRISSGYWSIPEAKWTVTATGKLGNSKEGKKPSWDSTASGDDPFQIQSSDFSEITGDKYNLFLEAGLDAGSFSPLGEISFRVFYRTASQSFDLLDIALDSTGAIVTSAIPASSSLSIYRLSSLDEGPTENPSNLISLADIQAELDVDANKRTIIEPLYFGLVLSNLDVPTVSFSANDVVAETGVDLSVSDAAAVPEPSSYMLTTVGVGLIGLMARRRRLSGKPDSRSSHSGAHTDRFKCPAGESVASLYLASRRLQAST
jgi:hypothetical protein